MPNGKIKSIKDIIRSEPKVTIPELSDLTGRSPRTVSRELRRYQDRGEIRREGARKKGKWVIVG